ncbi:hypothetical protein [Candidatus Agathobaculum pullicola]|uniref:hypothetical protein n=1 Tax=Candidatus Agathobaculum pullicola TaxID=2838426 RepID=UPI003F93BEE2
MVKGISRRVVVVRPDEHGVFEQAIFLVRDCTVPRSDAVREACRIANRYLVGRGSHRRSSWLRPAIAFALGAVAASGIWAVLWLLV